MNWRSMSFFRRYSRYSVDKRIRGKKYEASELSERNGGKHESWKEDGKRGEEGKKEAAPAYAGGEETEHEIFTSRCADAGIFQRSLWMLYYRCS